MKTLILFFILSLALFTNLQSQKLTNIWTQNSNFIQYTADYLVLPSYNNKYLVYELTGLSNYLYIINTLTRDTLFHHIADISLNFLGLNNNDKAFYFSRKDNKDSTMTLNKLDLINNEIKDTLFNFYTDNFDVSYDKNYLFLIHQGQNVDTSFIFDLDNFQLIQAKIHNRDLGDLYKIAISNNHKYIAYGYVHGLLLNNFDTDSLIHLYWPSSSINTRIIFTKNDSLIITSRIFSDAFDIYSVASGDSIKTISTNGLVAFDFYEYFPNSINIKLRNDYILDLTSDSCFTNPLPGINLPVVINDSLYYLSYDKGLFLTDTMCNIIEEYLNPIAFKSIDNDGNIITETQSNLKKEYRILDSQTGNIIKYKTYSVINDLRGQYIYYYSLDQNNIPHFYIKDFYSDGIIDSMSYNSIKGTPSYFSISDDKNIGSIYIGDSILYVINRINNNVDSLSCRKGGYYKINNENYLLTYNNAGLNIIDVHTKDTLFSNYISSTTSQKKILSNVNLLSNYLVYNYLEETYSTQAYKNIVYVIDLKTGDTIKKIQKDTITSIYFVPNIKTFYNRYFLITYIDGSNLLYDILTDSVFYKFINPDTAFNIINIAKDFKKLFALFDYKIMGNLYYYYGYFNTGIEYITDVKEGTQTINSKNIYSYPNPTTQAATIKFDIEQPANISLKLTDILGNRITLIDNQFMDRGSHSYDWDASYYPAGVYYYLLEINGRDTLQCVQTGKVVVVK